MLFFHFENFQVPENISSANICEYTDNGAQSALYCGITTSASTRPLYMDDPLGVCSKPPEKEENAPEKI